MKHISDFLATAESADDLTEIAPDTFIDAGLETLFEIALDNDKVLQSEYDALLRRLGVFTAPDEIDPAVEHTYSPICSYIRFQQRLTAGDEYALAIDRAVAAYYIQHGKRDAIARNSIRRSIAPFALEFGRNH